MSIVKQAKKYAAIARHGEQLKILFGLPHETNSVELYAKLHRIEASARRYAERLCNGEEEQDAARDTAIMCRVRKLLPDESVPIVINGDPRGYALKIPDAWMCKHRDEPRVCGGFHQDWGGNGIICPSF